MVDPAFLLSTTRRLLEALPTTLGLFAGTVLIGVPLAVGLLLARAGPIAALRRLAQGYVFVFRGSPMLVQLFLLYYGLGQFGLIRTSPFWPVLRDPFCCAMIVMAMCTASYTSEILRGALRAVPAGEIEAARAVGMPAWRIAWRIQAPQVLRLALPAYSTELTLVLKSTALASLVTVWEVTGVAQKIISQTYRTFEVFACAAAIYLAVNVLLLALVALAERRLSRHARPPARSPALPPAAAGATP